MYCKKCKDAGHRCTCDVDVVALLNQRDELNRRLEEHKETSLAIIEKLRFEKRELEDRAWTLEQTIKKLEARIEGAYEALVGMVKKSLEAK